MGPRWRTWWAYARGAGSDELWIGWLLALCLLLPASVVAALWPAARPPLAGVCCGAGLAFITLAVAAARRRAVAGVATFDDLQAGIVAVLKDAYVRGALTLADYEAYVGRSLPPPVRGFDAARVPLRLTRWPDMALRPLACTGAILLLASGLALAWPASPATSAPASGAVSAAQGFHQSLFDDDCD
jgi:hypothetical protein